MSRIGALPQACGVRRLRMRAECALACTASGRGLLVLIGLREGDAEADAEYLCVRRCCGVCSLR